jgi:Holliday junction DNA helicase RuvA
MLLSVSGVGPKIALTILSSGDIHSQKEAIGSGDASFFSQMSGVGKKTAERIIVELRDKIGVIDGPGAGTTGSSDVFDALVGLGYSTYEVRKVLGDVDRSIGTEEQLKQALKLLSR